MPETQLLTVAIGLFVGIVLALTGAGGAVLSIPLLVFFLHLKVIEAAPIGLLTLMFSATIGALLEFKAGTVRYRAAGLIAVFGMAMTPFGVWLGQRLPNHVVEIIFACVLALVSLRMWREAPGENLNHAPPACQTNPATSRLFWNAACTRRLSLTGAVSGLLSGLIGVGGGFVIVPTLRKVSNFTMPTIIATSFAVTALISAAGFTSFVVQHEAIQWHIALTFSLSTLTGMLVFRQFSAKIPANVSQKSFAVLALAVAVSMAFKAFH